MNLSRGHHPTELILARQRADRRYYTENSPENFRSHNACHVTYMCEMLHKQFARPPASEQFDFRAEPC